MDLSMRITLKQLEVFIAVAQSGSVTRAAESLSITQSATSMSLADFETQLGRKLFDRMGKRLQLNDCGPATAAQGAGCHCPHQ
jgi:DNA-binding transcriptional LysR family regulator